MFPEQIAAGLRPWQPLKLYMGGVRENEDWTIRVDTGDYDPVLGDSYQTFARLGLSFQRSQNSGRFSPQPGPSVSYYKRLQSMVDAPAKEKTFFDGIDITIPGLYRALRQDARRPAPMACSTTIDREMKAAIQAFQVDRSVSRRCRRSPRRSRPRARRARTWANDRRRDADARRERAADRRCHSRGARHHADRDRAADRHAGSDRSVQCLARRRCRRRPGPDVRGSDDVRRTAVRPKLSDLRLSVEGEPSGNWAIAAARCRDQGCGTEPADCPQVRGHGPGECAADAAVFHARIDPGCALHRRGRSPQISGRRPRPASTCTAQIRGQRRACRVPPARSRGSRPISRTATTRRVLAVVPAIAVTLRPVQAVARLGRALEDSEVESRRHQQS